MLAAFLTFCCAQRTRVASLTHLPLCFQCSWYSPPVIDLICARNSSSVTPSILNRQNQSRARRSVRRLARDQLASVTLLLPINTTGVKPSAERRNCQLYMISYDIYSFLSTAICGSNFCHSLKWLAFDETNSPPFCQRKKQPPHLVSDCLNAVFSVVVRISVFFVFGN